MPGFYHAIFHEKERQLVVSKARDFVLECFQQAMRRESLLHADLRGYTKDEFDRLCRPGNPLFGLMRLGMKTIGRLSLGIRLGWAAGFDSGRTLDYVYENQPRGITSLGCWI